MTDPNTPAYPLKLAKKQINGVVVEYDIHAGLTKREHYTGLAMQGILANTVIPYSEAIVLVRDAVNIADLLIKELNKEDRDA